MFKKVWLLFIFIILVVLGFQNCSDPKIQMLEAPTVKKINSLELKADFCPKLELREIGKSKYIFLIDLSISNFGSWFQDPQAPGYYFFDPDTAKDFNAQRFDAIESFMNNCGAGDNIEYSIIGFSSTAGVLPMNYDGSQALSCEGLVFKNKSQALLDLNKMKTEHLKERDWYVQWDYDTKDYLNTTYTPPLTRETSYSAALQCMESVVTEDLISSDTNKFDSYKVFFVSDGSPKDPKGVGCRATGSPYATPEECYLETAIDLLSKTVQLADSKNLNFSLFPLFYGDEDTPDILQTMAKAGGGNEVFKAENFADNDIFCKILTLFLGLEYRPNSITMFNLSSLVRDGQVLADSDMDGITDEDEMMLKSDPRHPRSLVSGVLDGICKRLGGKEECQKELDKISCDANLYNKWGLSDCDIKILGIPTTNNSDWGLDSDSDGLSDYLEIVKGTNPISNDINSDPDGDGLTNLEELSRGTDPQKFTDKIDSENLNDFSFEQTDSASLNCPLGKWNLKSRWVNAAETLDHQNTNPWFAGVSEIGLQHIVVNYRISSQNKDNIEHSYYGNYFNLVRKYNGELIPTEEGGEILKSRNFILLGTVYP